MELKFIKNDLNQNSPRVVWTALQNLGRVEAHEREEASAILASYLSHGDPMLRYTALLSVLELLVVDDHFEQVKLMLNDADPKIREAAVIALGKSSNGTVTGMLIDLLSSRHNEIRFQAPISLAERGDQRAAKPLLSLLDREGDVEIRINVIAALGDLGVDRALDTLIGISENDTYEIVRFEAACAAGRMGDRRAATPLSQWADHFEYGLTACTVLDDLEETSVTSVLSQKYKKLFLPAARKLPLAATLARLGDDRGRDYLSGKTTSFSLETRILAMERLGRTKRAWAVEPLIAAVRKKDAHGREASLAALAELGLPEAKEALKALLAEPGLHDRISRDIVETLSAMETEEI